MGGGALSQVGTANVSVANEVAEVQKLLRASGLTCTMHSAGTTVGEPSFFSFLGRGGDGGLVDPMLGCGYIYIYIYPCLCVYVWS